MTMADDLSRRSASVGASIVLHAIALAMLARSGTMQLAIDSAPLLLTFVEAGRHSAAPGEKMEELRQRAAPDVPDVAAAPAAPAPAVATADPVVEKAVVPEPEPKPRKPPPVRPLQSAPAAPAAAAPAARTDGVASLGNGRGSAVPGSLPGSLAGSDTRSGAPQWAATARVRYEELLFAWMNRHKEYPLLAQRRGIQGRGSVRVRIDRAGRVLERALDSSTGQSLLDQAALDMVRRASPFPAVPADYAGSSFEFVAPIEYRLR